MNVTIYPSSLSGAIEAPASKSSMQRSCAAALIRKGKTIIRQPGHSNDDKAALDIIKRLGAKTIFIDGEWRIESEGVQPISPEIHCGESGLSIRMFTPLAGLSAQPIRVAGSGSLLTRPMHFFDEILPQVGVEVMSNDGKLPLLLKGPLQPKDIEVDGSLSSQFLTGLLMAYSASNAQGVTITVNDLKSKPYIDLTLHVLKQFGLPVPTHDDYKTFYFDGKPPLEKEEVIYTVEGDWSGGAFLLVAGAIAGNITVRGLDLSSTQADKKIIDALMDANAGIAMDGKGIVLMQSHLKAFQFDATDCPDLFPPLVALAAYCNGKTIIKGVSRLAHKESDRALTLQEEFGKMGLSIVLDGDEMIIDGGQGLKGAQVHSRHDHRIAMATAVAALKAEGDTVIEEANAINKSYPDFFRDLKKLGAHVSLPGILSHLSNS